MCPAVRRSWSGQFEASSAMCGIVGIIAAEQDVSADLVRGITRLEYRGYDSCGIALKNGSGIVINKEIGGPTKLGSDGFFEGLSGSQGIAHTRWATHGGVSKSNAHPHLSSDGSVAIVHNGVLTNYREIRDRLIEDGVSFQSETDSEISANLIAQELHGEGDIRDAVLRAARQLRGTYAIAIMVESDPNRLWAIRQESPLVVGFAKDRVIVASDPMALASGCDALVHVEDGEFVEITPNSCKILRIADGEEVEREKTPITGMLEDPELGQYPHYMAKEMAESSDALRAALALPLEVVDAAAEELINARRAFLTGMGTAYHMAYFGHHLLASLAKVYCPVVTSDELPSVVTFEQGDAVLGVSQSGETYDTLRALRTAHAAGARTLAVCNVQNSSMARQVDRLLFQGAGAEVAVLATKSAMSQSFVLARVALQAGRKNGNLTVEQHAAFEKELQELPAVIEEWRERIDQESREAAVRFLGLEKWFFLGRGLYAPVALEGALKFKEVTYRHAEGMAAGFLKHGTISLIDPEMGTAMFLPPAAEEELRQLTMTALEEVRSRGGPMLAVGSLEDSERQQVDACITTPGKSLLTDGFLQILAGQYLAYHTARALGRDVDRPRALAKSVTVP